MRLYLASVTDYRLWGGDKMELFLAGLTALFHYNGNNIILGSSMPTIPPHTHTHTQEMKLFLAGEHGAKNGLQRERERGWQDLSILESYYYARKNPLFERLYYKGVDLLLDSGAFTFMVSGAKIDWYKYVEDYAAFINKYQIEKFFELDIDSIIGLQEVERLREKLETLTGRKCIPVWHKSRGIDYWKKMCEEYSYIAIGGIVSKEIPRGKIASIATSLINMAHAKGVKVHLLGYTPCDILAENIPLDSADSTTWIVGNRSGTIYKFDGRKICKYNAPKGKRLKASEVARHNFYEWAKYQKFLKYK